MIEFGRSYIFGGKAYATMEEAQAEAVKALVMSKNSSLAMDYVQLLSDLVIKNKAPLLAILTLTDASRPRARGVRKPRKASPAPAKTEPQPQQANLPAA